MRSISAFSAAENCETKAADSYKDGMRDGAFREARKNMNKFKFESEFVEVNNQVLKIYCESENNSFCCLIDTYGDPYTIYYPLNALNENEEQNFRDQIFDYLGKKYPEYF